jgi:hypothetical protein
MDKIFMLIVLLIIGFWGYLKYSDSESWVAVIDSNVIMEYSSYSDCVEGVKSQINVNEQAYSCSRD